MHGIAQRAAHNRKLRLKVKKPKGHIAQRLLDQLPEGYRRELKRGNLEEEVGFELPLWETRTERWNFVGFMDLLYPFVEKGTARFLDYKTTSDLKWAKSEYELPNLRQVITYSYIVFGWFPEAKRVEATYNYATTRGKTPRGIHGHTVKTVMRRRDVEAVWNLKLYQEMETISEAKHVTRAKDITPNFGACDNYGGCPHRSRCAKVMFSRR